MLHGDVIPVSRRTMQYGQTVINGHPAVNGDIVLMPDNPAEWWASLETDTCVCHGQLVTECTFEQEADSLCQEWLDRNGYTL